jgi:hypothetical protein
LTTLTEDYGRVSMHGVREDILDRQAQALAAVPQGADPGRVRQC